jgi:23S rRNA pseudouridine2605 synthase
MSEERGERIAKWLARAGVASRRDAEKLIAEGRVVLNGARVEQPATFVQPGDAVVFDGKPVATPEHTRLFRYHKPDGLVTTHRDPEGRPTVFEKIPAGLPRLISVGRLDLTSEGLLLLTNDGELARRLELPANGWLRRYRGVRYGPIEAGLDARKGTNSWLTVSIQEGKNREVRRVMQHLGLSVTRLIRTAYGPFQLGVLPKGAVEEVSPKVMRDQLGVDAPPRIKRGVELAAEARAARASEEAGVAEAAPQKPKRPPRARRAGDPHRTPWGAKAPRGR